MTTLRERLTEIVAGWRSDHDQARNDYHPHFRLASERQIGHMVSAIERLLAETVGEAEGAAWTALNRIARELGLPSHAAPGTVVEAIVALVAQVAAMRACVPAASGDSESFLSGLEGEPITEPCLHCGLQCDMERTAIYAHGDRLVHLACDYAAVRAKLARLEGINALHAEIVDDEARLTADLERERARLAGRL